MADTMLHFNNNDLTSHFLTNEELMNICPMAFKTNPTNPKVSDKYIMATTMDVVNDMAKLGWYPVQAKQCRGKKGSKGIRSFHMLAFQNPDIKVLSGNDIEAYPRIILQNSHDGFNSFKFMVGIFRIVCSNGLIVCDEEFANLAIRHINYTFEELRDTINIVVAKLPNKIEVLNQMRNTELSEEDKKEFAKKVIKIRKGLDADDNLDISDDTIIDILTPVRKEDNGNSLWNVFNVLQEKVIKGNFNFSSDGKKSRKMRKIVSPIKDIKINTELFNIANSYVKVAA